MANLKNYLKQSGIRYPNSAALQVAGESFSYSELYDMACRFSCGLNALQMAQDLKVALWLPKSLQAYVSIFGSVEQGATFIPIDISTPAARVNYILNDSGADIFICRAADYRSLFESKLCSVKVVILVGQEESRTVYPACRYLYWADFMNTDLTACSAARPTLDDESIAYIFYTSGSTGLRP